MLMHNDLEAHCASVESLGVNTKEDAGPREESGISKIVSLDDRNKCKQNQCVAFARAQSI